MKNLLGVIFTTFLLSTIFLSGCAPASTHPAFTPSPQGKTITVTNINDSGDGTLRQALLDAEVGDTIIFDPTIFPPDAPATITLSTPLPPLVQGNLTIDADGAGVILDGSQLSGEQNGLDINSWHNIVRGLQILHFGLAAVGLQEGVRGNLIEENLLSGNGGFGVGIWGTGTTENSIRNNIIGTDLSGMIADNLSGDGIHIYSAKQNTITGNLIAGVGQSGIYICCGGTGNTISNNTIGLASDGSTPLPNRQAGITIDQDAQGNIIGPENVIAYNPVGVRIMYASSVGNTITQNRILKNRESISLEKGGNGIAIAPTIMGFDMNAGTIVGVTCANCTVEIFSTDSNQGDVYEGQTTSDSTGYFTLNVGGAFGGPYLTATATDATGNTSDFSQPSPEGKTIIVTSVKDSGPGSLRQAITDAKSGDKITFDPVVFPPENPVAIMLVSGLPHIREDHITLDASNAGVVVNGTRVETSEEGEEGIEIESRYNVIKGLQMVGFSGPALKLTGWAQFNVIGGDRSVGLGPIGEGNLFSDSLEGITVFGSNNVITGNLIGTDATGLESLGNRCGGVAMQENASRNVVGPNNTIAFNGCGGVEIRSMDAHTNVITANSIHDNSIQATWRDGIDVYRIWGPGWSTWPTVPVILGFDLSAGTVEGLTCPGCIVEIFSTDGVEGEVYEGTAEADQYGQFSLNRAQAFSGSSLVATSRSLGGNTSEFSLPTIGKLQHSVLQEGNDSLKTMIENKSLKELTGNYIGEPWDGGNWLEADCSPQDHSNFTLTAEMGFKTVRVSLDLLDFIRAKEEGAFTSFEINPCFDGLISLYAENGVTVVYTIEYWDEALGFRQEKRFETDDEVNGYLEHIRFIVRNFSDRVQYFEIMGEAYHGVDAEDYIEVVRKAVQVIHEESPTARVVAGGGIGFFDRLYERQWLFTLLRSDVMPLIDAINLHPMYGVSPDYADTRRYYYDYPETITEIKKEAETHGFTGEYIAEEMSWPISLKPYAATPWLYTEPMSAKYMARAIVINRGLDLWAGISFDPIEQPFTGHTVRNLSNVMDGAAPEPLTVQIESGAANIASYAFATPNGERLIALWTDGIAVDYDPGVPATLTIPGFTAQKAIGIDVVAGYQQSLTLESSNGDLVIRSLIVKDYPIFIRLIP